MRTPASLDRFYAFPTSPPSTGHEQASLFSASSHRNCPGIRTCSAVVITRLEISRPPAASEGLVLIVRIYSKEGMGTRDFFARGTINAGAIL